MFATLVIITSFGSAFTGLAVLMFGEWRKFTLKFAGVALSTGAAVWLIAMDILYGNIWHVAHETDLFVNQKLLYTLTRNIAFIIFHITTGRDAIKLRYKDRRKKLPA